MTSPVAASLRDLKLRYVAVAGVIGAAVVLTGCAGGSGSPSASKATTTTRAAANSNFNSNAAASAALVGLVQAWVPARNTEEAADHASVNAAALVNADITKQNQRIQQDDTTVQQNQYGLGCDAADFSTYGSCVQGEEQTAATAQNDVAAAEAQVQTDDQQYATESSTFGAALSTFISQIEAMNWPNSMESTVSDLVSAAQAFRTDYADAAAETNETPQSTTSAITAQTGTDAGTLSDAVSAVNADLLHLVPSASTI